MAPRRATGDAAYFHDDIDDRSLLLNGDSPSSSASSSSSSKSRTLRVWLVLLPLALLAAAAIATGVTLSPLLRAPSNQQLGESVREVQVNVSAAPPTAATLHLTLATLPPRSHVHRLTVRSCSCSARGATLPHTLFTLRSLRDFDFELGSHSRSTPAEQAIDLAVSDVDYDNVNQADSLDCKVSITLGLFGFIPIGVSHHFTVPLAVPLAVPLPSSLLDLSSALSLDHHRAHHHSSGNATASSPGISIHGLLPHRAVHVSFHLSLLETMPSLRDFRLHLPATFWALWPADHSAADVADVGDVAAEAILARAVSLLRLAPPSGQHMLLVALDHPVEINLLGSSELHLTFRVGHLSQPDPARVPTVSSLPLALAAYSSHILSAINSRRPLLLRPLSATPNLFTHSLGSYAAVPFTALNLQDPCAYSFTANLTLVDATDSHRLAARAGGSVDTCNVGASVDFDVTWDADRVAAGSVRFTDLDTTHFFLDASLALPTLSDTDYRQFNLTSRGSSDSTYNGVTTVTVVGSVGDTDSNLLGLSLNVSYDDTRQAVGLSATALHRSSPDAPAEYWTAHSSALYSDNVPFAHSQLTLGITTLVHQFPDGGSELLFRLDHAVLTESLQAYSNASLVFFGFYVASIGLADDASIGGIFGLLLREPSFSIKGNLAGDNVDFQGILSISGMATSGGPDDSTTVDVDRSFFAVYTSSTSDQYFSLERAHLVVSAASNTVQLDVSQLYLYYLIDSPSDLSVWSQASTEPQYLQFDMTVLGSFPWAPSLQASCSLAWGQGLANTRAALSGLQVPYPYNDMAVQVTLDLTYVYQGYDEGRHWLRPAVYLELHGNSLRVDYTDQPDGPHYFFEAPDFDLLLDTRADHSQDWLDLLTVKLITAGQVLENVFSGDQSTQQLYYSLALLTMQKIDSNNLRNEAMLQLAFSPTGFAVEVRGSAPIYLPPSSPDPDYVQTNISASALWVNDAGSPSQQAVVQANGTIFLDARYSIFGLENIAVAWLWNENPVEVIARLQYLRCFFGYLLWNCAMQELLLNPDWVAQPISGALQADLVHSSGDSSGSWSARGYTLNPDGPVNVNLTSTATWQWQKSTLYAVHVEKLTVEQVNSEKVLQTYLTAKNMVASLAPQYDWTLMGAADIKAAVGFFQFRDMTPLYVNSSAALKWDVSGDWSQPKVESLAGAVVVREEPDDVLCDIKLDLVVKIAG